MLGSRTGLGKALVIAACLAIMGCATGGDDNSSSGSSGGSSGGDDGATSDVTSPVDGTADSGHPGQDSSTPADSGGPADSSAGGDAGNDGTVEDTGTGPGDAAEDATDTGAPFDASDGGGPADASDGGSGQPDAADSGPVDSGSQPDASDATAPDTTPPSVPLGLAQSGATTSTISLTWSPSTDPDSPVAGYNIYRNGTKVGTSASPGFTDMGLTLNTTYSYTVSAYDPSNNTSAQSTAIMASTSTDTTAPTVPTGLAQTGATTSTVSLSWTASTDPDSPVAGYNVFRNGTKVGTPTTPTFTDTGLAIMTAYSYTVSAYDPSNNTSALTAPVMGSTSPDTTPPTVPTGLAQTGATTTTISLSWTASTDPDSPVGGYNIYRNTTKVGTSPTPSFTDTGLTPGTTYSYTVSAYDIYTNTSAQTGAVNAATTEPIALVQQAASSTLTTVMSWPVTFASTPKAGHLIVVAVGWTDTTSAIKTITDTAGNTYQLAVGPTPLSPDLTQAIYFATGVKAAATTITATFNAAAASIDLRAAEYSGLSALDQKATAAGRSTAANSGPVTTTTAHELLFAAGMCTDLYPNPSTPGFTMLAVTPNGNMFEDEIVAATGTYSATATLASATVGWVIQIATFK
jgi:chitodextrinase